MKLFYVSLCRSLGGYYITFLAEEESIVRDHVRTYYGGVWCSIYTEKPCHSGVRGILREDDPIVLNSPEWE